MKPETSEQLFIEELFMHSVDSKKIKDSKLLNLDKLTGDASTRRYYRLETSDDTFVVCLDNPSDDKDGNLFIKIQSYLEKNGIRVPKIIDKNLKKGYLLEEDLGDTTLLQKLSQVNSREEEFNLYKEVIDQLVDMHRIDTSKSKLKIFKTSFDYNKLIEEIDFSIKFFVEKFLGYDDEKAHRQIRDFFSPICQRLSAEKMVFTHRDFHSRNLMYKNNEFVMIDFQDARMGVPQYDLASLLDDCYYEIGIENKLKLLNYYYKKVDCEYIQQTNFDDFLSLYNDMVIQRAYKAIGSFSYIYDKRKDFRYTKYIGFAMEKLKQIMLIDPRYDNLRKVLFKIYYEN